MATTNDSAVVNLGRLKAFKIKLLDLIADSIVNAKTTPLQSSSSYHPAKVLGDYGIAIGNNTSAKSNGCVSLGINAVSEQEDAMAIGSRSEAIGEKCLAAGAGSVAKSVDCTAVGDTAVAFGQGGNTAIGSKANIDSASGSEAIGAKSKVNGGVSYAVALGAESVANDDKTVSVGNDSLKRRFVNVANPVNPTDAATKGYVDSVSSGMHIVAITNVSSVLASSQLSEIDQYWPNVIIYARSDNTIFSPVSKVAPSNAVKYFTFIHVENTHNSDDGVSNGSANILKMVQIVVNATDGSITINTNMSLSPIIATNPGLSTGSQNRIKAIGDNSIAAGNNSSAMSKYAIALGFNSLATGTGAVAIGVKANAEHLGGIALGNSSATDKNSQVSIGNKTSGITRYLSNVKDPVEDQDAATRYWVKNADRSDVFMPNFTMTIPGNGTGEFYLEANSDLNWIAVRGYAYWNAFSDAWATMTNLPGESNNNWWIKTELKVPDKMIPKANFIGYAGALDLLGNRTVPYYSDKIAVGTDGYIYLTAWSTNHGSTPLGVLCLGHRFYL